MGEVIRFPEQPNIKYGVSQKLAEISILHFDIEQEIKVYEQDAVVIPFPIKQEPGDLIA